MAESFELPDKEEKLKIDLEDDVRAFLMQRLAWNRMSPAQRAELQSIGVDAKRLRRPSYLSVSSGHDDGPPEAAKSPCRVGAEGVMAHADEQFVHLAFKCGNPKHSFHYSTFGLDTVAALARACEKTWPGSISGELIDPEEFKAVEREVRRILDPGDDDVDLDDVDLDEDLEDTEDEDDEDDDDDFFI